MIDRLRPPAAADVSSPEPFPHRWVLRVLVTIAAFQIVLGLSAAVAAGAAGQAPGILLPRLLLTAAFGGAGLLLAAASARDARCTFLSAAFALAASAFAREVPAALGVAWPGLIDLVFRGVFPEAFAPAALWQFAAAFPGVKRFTAADTLARRFAGAAWVLGFVLFAVNIALAYGLADAEAVPLGRNGANNLFWDLFAVSTLPALLAIFVRARRSTLVDQRKTRRFAVALAIGGGPFAITGVARMAFPPLDTWLATAAPGERIWLDGVVLGTLVSLPLRTTFAVIVDRPFESRIALPTFVRSWPLIGRYRASGGVRRPRRAERDGHLSVVLERLARARGSRELFAIVRRELQFGLGAGPVRIADPASLPADSALRSILEESRGPLDVSPEGELFGLLPQDDRDWLVANAVAVTAALKRRDGSLAAVVALAPRSGGRRFDRTDRGFVATVVAGAAVAYEGFDSPARVSQGESEAALECPACGLVTEREPLPCTCGVEAEPAALPARLAGKFEVRRRLGSGGMGVVYAAHDTVLDRDVALKTLPGLRDGTVARLAEEARAMAALNHEAVATIFGVEFWHQIPVLVVEYFPNGTLAWRLAQGPMPVDELVSLGQRLARALNYMHGRAVLHRDVKPGNIGLTETGAAKLLDFGLTAESHPFAGTPEYLPPEALRGEPPNRANDLWGLTMVLRNTCGDGIALPASLAAFFDRAFALDPAYRFQSAEEYGRALAHVAKEIAPDAVKAGRHD